VGVRLMISPIRTRTMKRLNLPLDLLRHPSTEHAGRVVVYAHIVAPWAARTARPITTASLTLTNG
jgi:hypothetical protein